MQKIKVMPTSKHLDKHLISLDTEKNEYKEFPMARYRVDYKYQELGKPSTSSRSITVTADSSTEASERAKDKAKMDHPTCTIAITNVIKIA